MLDIKFRTTNFRRVDETFQEAINSLSTTSITNALNTVPPQQLNSLAGVTYDVSVLKWDNSHISFDT